MRLYIVIPKATKITVIQKDTAKKLMDKLKWNTETIWLSLRKIEYKRIRTTRDKQKWTNTVRDLYQAISIIMLNINSLNIPNKRQRVSDWIKK